MIRVFLILILFFSLGFAKQNVYILPQEAKEAKKSILSQIKQSQDSIYIAMYNFTYKKLAKALVKAKKRGVKVVVVLDSHKIKENTQYHYLKKNGIKSYLVKDKMHIKAAIFDQKTLLLGSPNWKKESFTSNHEILYSTSDFKNIQKVMTFFETMAR